MMIDRPLFVQMAHLTIGEILRKLQMPTTRAYRDFVIQ